MLLSPEKIEELSKWWLDAAEEVDWATTVARAQLKQVVEWLQSKNVAKLPDNSLIIALADDEGWQALLEEIK